MRMVCIDDSGIKQSERSFHNCLYQTDLKSSLTYGRQYKIHLCKRPGQSINGPKGISTIMDRYFTIHDDEKLQENEPTWVELINDDGEKEWYYLDRFTTIDKHRDYKLNKLGI